MVDANIKISKNIALKDFFNHYAGNIEGSMHRMNRVELLEHLGSFDEGSGLDKTDPKAYVADDIFIGCGAAASGIPEQEFLIYALEYFGHAG